MPTSSRSKSHKQSKRSSREYSDINDDVKMKQRNDHNDGQKTAVSGEKRKTNANGNVSDEFAMPTKRRREMIHGGSGRWNGDDGGDESEVVNIDDDYDDDNHKFNDLLTAVSDLKSKSSRKHNEWPMKEEMRNIELEKELEKRMKRREGYSDKDIKHKDKVYKYSEKDNKHKGETNRKREKEYHEDGNRDYKHREERYRDDVERDHRHKTGRARDDIDRKKRSRDHTSESESKNLKDGSHRHTNNLGRSPIYDDRVARHKDNKDVKRDNNKNKDEIRDYRSRDIQEQHLESKRHMHDGKIDPNLERGMSSPHNDDMEVTANHSRHRSFLDCKDYPPRDHHRGSKQEETKYSDVHEERARHNFNSDRDLSDKVCIEDLSTEKRLKSGSQLSPSSRNKISSHLPPQPPFKAGSDNLPGFGSSDDRGKLNNHNWKSADPNLGRTQTNWNNFSNWPYIPFHHVPPPMFNPFMYQSVPPMLGGPPMNMNHATMPYHFTGDGYGNWDDGRTELNNQSCESNVVGVDLQSAVQQNEDSVHGHTDEIWSGQTGPHENEENILDFNAPKVMKVTESSHVSMVEKDDDTLISRFYLSKIDVSKDLTNPELYDQCTSMLMDLEQASSASDECDCKILFLEEECVSNGASLFAAVDDSVFKKAMSLYTKQKVHFTAAADHPVENQEKESCEVKVKESCNNYDGSKEVDKLSGGGPLTNLLNSDLIDIGSVNLSRIHSPESTH